MEQVVVKFHEGTRVRLRGGALAPQPRNRRETERLTALGLTDEQVVRDVHAVHALLASSRQARRLERLFTAGEEILAARRSHGEARSGRELSDLDLYYRVRVAPGVTQVEVESLVSALNALASIEIAYAQPPVAPPGDIPPVTPNFEGGQGYLDPAPAGIDARYAWTVRGGRGKGVRIVDVEGAWKTTHEDLPALFYQGGVQINDRGWRYHGTAVLGELVAPANGYGVTGIAHRAQAGVESFAGQGTASAITNAAAAAGPGGIVLIELHAPGPSTPSSPCNCSENRCDYVPVEYRQDVFDAIAQATANGTLVIEAGGNGATDLDDPVYQGLFDRSRRDSGAILVGAGNSLDRSPTCLTNYGSRIDVQGWGSDVTTLGKGGPLFNGGGDENQHYTHAFGGTSSAAPIVAGAAAGLQGISLAAGRGYVRPFVMRQLLRETGTPQAADARRIGPLPNLRPAIDRLLAVPKDARCISQSAPSTMVAGQRYAVRVTMKNVGTLSWSPIGPQCGAYRLGSANPLDNRTWGRSRVELPAPVAPGGQATMSFTATAPAKPGTYIFQWHMVHECVEWFGGTCPSAAINVVPP